MKKPKLYIMVGLSGSGKSTIAQKLAQEHENTVIVSSDQIREELTGDYENQDRNDEVFKVFHKRIRENLENNKNVIADATNLTMKSRRAILQNIKRLDVEKICYIVPKPIPLCEIDNKNRYHPVPDEVLDKQILRFQVPFYEEGFSKIIVHRDIKWKEYQMDSIKVFFAMFDFDQKNPHHNMTLDSHCLNAYKLFCDDILHVKFINPEYHNGFVMGAKLHDVGKLMTQTFDENGIAHYFGHSNAGSYFILSQMTKSSFWTDNMLLDCCFLINYHMMPFSWDTEKTKKRWKERFGEYKYQMLLDFHECDIAR